jgi:hypothetical protein
MLQVGGQQVPDRSAADEKHLPPPFRFGEREGVFQ